MTTPLYSELVFHAVDDSIPKPATAELRVPTTPFDLASLDLTDHKGTANQVAGLFGGNSDSFLSQLGLARVTLVIDLGIDPIAAINGGDPRNIWETSTTDADSFRMSIPGANKRNALLAAGTKGQIANLAAAAWATYIAAFSGTGATVNMVDPETGSNTNIGAARLTVRPRQRPRV
jgi:hypothetical protein